MGKVHFFEEDDVDIKDEIIRASKDHEVFLSFNGDDQAEAFLDWWADHGLQAFKNWIDENEENYM